MTIFLSVLAAALTGSTAVAGMTKSITTNQTSASNQVNQSPVVRSSEMSREIAFSKELSRAIADFQVQTKLNEANVKEIIEQALKINEKEQITLDLSRLVGFETTSLYRLIESNQSLVDQILNKLWEAQLLAYNLETHSFNFTEATHLATYNSHVWVEYHWTWFMYWELHFDHQLAQEIARYGRLGWIIINIIGPVDGLWGVGLEIISEACAAVSEYFGNRDKGNGVCFRWDGPVPRDVVSR